MGIAARAATLMEKADNRQQEDITSALHRLTDSSQMGELFKVMGISSHADFKLAGF
jgi:SAM-dependent MidA family methyltransferase